MQPFRPFRLLLSTSIFKWCYLCITSNTHICNLLVFLFRCFVWIPNYICRNILVWIHLFGSCIAGPDVRSSRLNTNNTMHSNVMTRFEMHNIAIDAFGWFCKWFMKKTENARKKRNKRRNKAKQLFINMCDSVSWCTLHLRCIAFALLILSAASSSCYTWVHGKSMYFDVILYAENSRC